MSKLDEDFNKARTKYLKYIRLRGDCKSENGTRWKNFDEKLLVAEEDYHEIGDKIRKRDEKKATSKGCKQLNQSSTIEETKQPDKVVSKKTTPKDSKKIVAKKTETSYVIAGKDNGKTIWDL